MYVSVDTELSKGHGSVIGASYHLVTEGYVEIG
jgi:hypothetical protein